MRADLELMTVSIHIRHCWRMNYSGPCLFVAGCPVSIHIRHCWRMNFLRTVSTQRPPPCFNPHSPLLANEFCPCLFCVYPAGSFNPHSPLLANELVVRQHQQHQLGFNPHSPLLANEFLGPEPLCVRGYCFNPHSPLLANELP